jgi:hypothetical protein
MAVGTKQSGAVHELINLHSFPADDLVLTKSGSLGMFLKLGVCDPECLDKAALDRITHAAGEALRQVQPGIRVNTIRLKTAGPNIPRQASYTNEAAGELVTNYVDAVEKRAGNLYSEEIYLGFFLKIPAAKTGPLSPWRFWTKKYLKLLRKAYEKTEQTLRRNVEACSLLLNDVIAAEPIGKEAIFNLLLRMLNPAPEKQDLKLPSNEHIDFFVANEHIGCFDDHLRIGNRFVIVLTLKAPPSETRPNWLYAPLKVPCNFAVVQEALRLDEDKARSHVNLQQRLEWAPKLRQAV